MQYEKVGGCPRCGGPMIPMRDTGLTTGNADPRRVLVRSSPGEDSDGRLRPVPPPRAIGAAAMGQGSAASVEAIERLGCLSCSHRSESSASKSD